MCQCSVDNVGINVLYMCCRKNDPNIHCVCEAKNCLSGLYLLYINKQINIMLPNICTVCRSRHLDYVLQSFTFILRLYITNPLERKNGVCDKERSKKGAH
jgi:hypothetical protein